MKANSLCRRSAAAGIQRAEGERTFRLSFSSETPVVRYGESEILDHGEGAVDLSRLTEMGVVLFNHDRNRVVGRVRSCGVEEGRGVAEIEFDTDEESEKIFRKVEGGTLRGVSVNARIDAVEMVRAGATSADGRFHGPVYIARKWTPLEISIVSVPADANVGVGRDYEDETTKEETRMSEMTTNPIQTPPVVPEGTERQAQPVAAPLIPAAAPAVPVVPGLQGAADPTADERRRAADIMEICRSADMDPTDYIRSGASMEEVLRKVNAQLTAQKGPLPVAVQRDESDKYRAAASDALLLRGGISIERAADGAADLRHLSLRELAIETLTGEGVDNARRMDNDALLGELQRAYFSPTAAFPAILDQTVNKAYKSGYNLAATTFERWTVKGTLPDFKVSKGYYLKGAAGDFLHVPEGGELKHDVPVDHVRPGRQLQTYGRQFTLSREAFINDDIGYITSVPARYAAAARRTINKQVYGILTGNPVIYDGEKLFGDEHGNEYTPSKPSQEAIRGMLEKLMLMKDDDGNPLAASPKFILAPVGIASDIIQILGATSIAVNLNGVISTQNNPLAGRGFEVVEDPFLNTLADSIAWYMISDPNVLPFIQIDYLNGNEMPTIRRMEVPGQLGFVWDIWLDWGITALEYRGVIRNKGQ